LSSGKSNLINTGLYCFDKNVFKEKFRKNPRGEIEITDLVRNIHWHKAHFWVPVGYPWHILEANKMMMDCWREARIDSTATLKGRVQIEGPAVIEEQAVIESGTVLKGPCFIVEAVP